MKLLSYVLSSFENIMENRALLQIEQMLHFP